MTRVGLLISAILFANLKKRGKNERSKTISVIALEISSLQLDLVCARFFFSSSFCFGVHEKWGLVEKLSSGESNKWSERWEQMRQLSALLAAVLL